jgi:outer membrane immunogenic protein
MKMKTLIASAALLALPVAAQAADLGPVMKAPAPVVVAPVTNWTGFYVGGVIGAGSNTTKFTDHGQLLTYGETALKDLSLNIGGTVGFNWQYRSFVFGLEADWSWVDWDKSTNGFYAGYGYDNRINAQWDSFATARARAGYAVDNVLLYITGGVAWAKVKHSASYDFADPDYACGTNYYSSCVSKTNTGLAVGAGIEAMLGSNWSVKGEYLYLDFKTMSTHDTSYSYGYGPGYDWNDSAHIFRLGLNYRFGDYGKAPVMAKY